MLDVDNHFLALKGASVPRISMNSRKICAKIGRYYVDKIADITIIITRGLHLQATVKRSRFDLHLDLESQCAHSTVKSSNFSSFFGHNVLMSCSELSVEGKERKILMRAFNTGITLDSGRRNDTVTRKMSAFSWRHNVPLSCSNLLV